MPRSKHYGGYSTIEIKQLVHMKHFSPASELIKSQTWRINPFESIRPATSYGASTKTQLRRVDACRFCVALFRHSNVKKLVHSTHPVSSHWRYVDGSFRMSPAVGEIDKF